MLGVGGSDGHAWNATELSGPYAVPHQGIGNALGSAYAISNVLGSAYARY